MSFPATDRMWDLRLAVWETLLQDQYPTAKICYSWDLNHNQAHVQIEFENAYDAAHWHLIQPESIHPNQLLTSYHIMLSCGYEKQTQPNIC